MMRWFFIILITIPAICFGQSFEINHTEVAPSLLPIPGKPLTISASVKGTSDKTFKAKVLVVRDGLLLELNDSEAELIDPQTLGFSVVVPSPLAELSYQFIITSPHGFITNSKRFSVKRSCVPDILLANIPPNKQSDVSILNVQANGLQKDIELYDETLKLLGELEKEFEKK